MAKEKNITGKGTDPYSFDRDDSHPQHDMLRNEERFEPEHGWPSSMQRAPHTESRPSDPPLSHRAQHAIDYRKMVERQMRQFK